MAYGEKTQISHDFSVLPQLEAVEIDLINPLSVHFGANCHNFGHGEIIKPDKEEYL
jgi:hypothetical protein